VTTGVRWGVVAVAALLIVALVVWARGDEHHRGDDVGSVAQVSR
jgi:hypothetical protein